MHMLVVSVAIAILTVSTTAENCACPQGCHCSTGFIACERADLTAVPSCWPQEAVIISLMHNKIERVNENDFADLPHLQNLMLAHNRIRTVDDNAFQSLPSLTTIDLYGNNLNKYPTTALALAPNLQSIRLSGNPTICDVSFVMLQQTLALSNRAQVVDAENVCPKDVFGSLYSRCPHPPQIHHGKFLRTAGVYAIYRCNNGFVIREGNPRLTCTNSSHWAGEPPLCKDKISIEAEMSGDDASVSESIALFASHSGILTYTIPVQLGKRLVLNCSVPVSKQGTTELPRWNGPRGVRLLSTVNRTFVKNLWQLSAIQTIPLVTKENLGGYDCSAGGIRRLVAIGVSCPIPSIANAVTNPSSGALIFPQTLTVSCKSELTLVGNSQPMCMPNGSFIGTPKCGAVCSKPVIEHGFVVGSNFSFGAVIVVRCKPGYWLDGSSRARCDSGNWVYLDTGGKEPKCYYEYKFRAYNEKRYPLTSYITPGGSMVFQASSGMQVNLVCFGKSSTIVRNSHRVSDVKKNWTTMVIPHLNSHTTGSYWCQTTEYGKAKKILATLAVPCGNVSTLAKGHTLSAYPRYVYPATATSSCESGFQLEGSSFRQCAPNGSWSGKAPLCKEARMSISYHKLGGVGSGETAEAQELIATDFSYIKCSGPPGVKWKLPGSKDRQYATASRLLRASSEISNSTSILYTSGFTEDDIGTYICDHEGSGQRKIIRLVYPVTCGEPPRVKHAKVSKGPYTFNSTVVYTCKEGYALNASLRTFCGLDGEWNSIPSCRVQDPCKKPPYSSSWLLKVSVQTNFIDPTVCTGIRIDKNTVLVHDCSRSLQGSSKITVKESKGSKPVKVSGILPISSPYYYSLLKMETGLQGDILSVQQNAQPNATCYAIGRKSINSFKSVKFPVRFMEFIKSVPCGSTKHEVPEQHYAKLMAFTDKESCKVQSDFEKQMASGGVIVCPCIGQKEKPCLTALLTYQTSECKSAYPLAYTKFAAELNNMRSFFSASSAGKAE